MRHIFFAVPLHPNLKSKGMKADHGVGSTDHLGSLIMKFYDEYAQEIRRHMKYEEKTLFPDRLCISVNTVITHRRNIARKLQIHLPAGLTIYAIVNGLVDISSVKL